MKIVLATGNPGKVKELSTLLAQLNINIIPQSEFNFPEAIEDGLSFVENAIIKARHAAKHTRLPAIADDSGIEVDYLQGQPGIYSARFAGKNANATDNNHKLLTALKGVPKDKRTARFHCSLVFIRHQSDPSPIIAEGVWHGSILEDFQGESGFGYDPIFYVPTHNCSAAQLSDKQKNQISHRGQALQTLKQLLTINGVGI